MRKKKWIQSAIKRPDALKRKALRAGLIKSMDERLSQTDLAKLASQAKKKGDTTTLRQVNLARTLIKLNRRKRRK